MVRVGKVMDRATKQRQRHMGSHLKGAKHRSKHAKVAVSAGKDTAEHLQKMADPRYEPLIAPGHSNDREFHEIETRLHKLEKKAEYPKLLKEWKNIAEERHYVAELLSKMSPKDRKKNEQYT